MLFSVCSIHVLVSRTKDPPVKQSNALQAKYEIQEQLTIAHGQGLNAVFAETAMRLTDRRSHAIIHCIPLDDQAFHRAPLVFKKAMVEAESEWSQHHAKAAIDTRAKV